MWIKGLMRSITERCRSPLCGVLLLSAYYLLIIIGLMLMYGKGELRSADFIYQGF